MFVVHLVGLAVIASAPGVAHDRCAAPRADTKPTPQARARPLNEMPPARQVLTVLRQVDGCHVLLVKDDGRIIEEPVGRPDRRRVFRP